ncbi:MAG: phage portal protein [Muribaculaceae bacterium]|nr:phage portal protein [Lachnospiraceae bacterium]MCM1297714.1 phage portal protein [Muribaculaceae bacterium]
MASINDYIDFSKDASTIISSLKEKTIYVPKWSFLKKDYNFKEHYILRDKQNLRDKVRPDGSVEKSSRISIGLERLLVRRMSEFMFAIPVKRVFHNTENNKTRQAIAKAIDAIYKYSRIDTHNLNRSKDYFACCEIFTLWYAVKFPNTLYGFNSQYKLKCRTFSPKDGTSLYPLFDEYGDMIAMSYGYTTKIGNQSTDWFETYTDSSHYKWRRGNGGWELVGNPEEIVLMKIPGVYLYRSEAIYEELTELRKEIEYTISRNSNVIAYNSAPILKVIGNLIGAEKKGEDQRVWRMEQGGNVEYVAWSQSNQAISYHIEFLINLYWTLSQMPDISFSNMKALGNIGYDARETLLTDAHLKVGDESGVWIEGFERETNVIKAFLKKMNTSWENDIDDVEVEHVITPFIQRQEDAEIKKRMLANGGKPIESQRESIQRYGRSSNPDATMKQIAKEEAESAQAAIPDIFGSAL